MQVPGKLHEEHAQLHCPVTDVVACGQASPLSTSNFKFVLTQLMSTGVANNVVAPQLTDTLGWRLYLHGPRFASETLVWSAESDFIRR